MRKPITLALPLLAVAGLTNKEAAAALLLRPMNQHHNFLLCLALTTALLAGCATSPAPDEQLETTKFTIRSTDKFVLLDQSAQACVECTGLQERILPDGRLEVAANVKNLEKRDLVVQINCVFKDEQGLSTEEETSFRKLTLPEGSTQVVQFTSVNNQARKYTIRVREAQ
jgi:uncharacterized protein YcfL